MIKSNTDIKLFYVFFKIGLCTIGGGYAMIPMIQQEVVEKRKWLTRNEFINVLSISQAMPGVFASNIASHIGYKLGGLRSSIIAIIGSIFPSIIIILILAFFFKQANENIYIQRAFMAMRPAVVSLIAVSVFRMLENNKINITFIFISILVALSIYFISIISPIYIVIITIISSIIYSLIFKQQR